MEESKHSALKQKIGDFYHYYVALYYMLEHSDWDNCDIEKNGDISLLNSSNEIIRSIEVKYHSQEEELIPHSIELWKTIHNFYNDFERYHENTELFLYTVSTIPTENILSNWNVLSSDEKYELLMNAALTKEDVVYTTIEKFYKVIVEDTEKLKNVLDKFTIISDKEYFTEFKEKITTNAYFRIFNSPTKKENSLFSLMETIFSAFKDVHTWNIKFDEFTAKLSEISINAHQIVMRSDDDIDEIEIDKDVHQKSLFVKKLQDIDKDEMTIGFAIEDYAKAIYEMKKRYDFINPLDLNKRIGTYERSLIREYLITKNKFHPNEETIIKQSQSFYDSIQSLSKIPFIPKIFDDQTTYFQKGYFHILADDDEDSKQKIIWHLGKS